MARNSLKIRVNKKKIHVYGRVSLPSTTTGHTMQKSVRWVLFLRTILYTLVTFEIEQPHLYRVHSRPSFDGIADAYNNDIQLRCMGCCLAANNYYYTVRLQRWHVDIAYFQVYSAKTLKINRTPRLGVLSLSHRTRSHIYTKRVITMKLVSYVSVDYVVII